MVRKVIDVNKQLVTTRLTHLVGGGGGGNRMNILGNLYYFSRFHSSGSQSFLGHGPT